MPTPELPSSLQGFEPPDTTIRQHEKWMRALGGERQPQLEEPGFLCPVLSTFLGDLGQVALSPDLGFPSVK